MIPGFELEPVGADAAFFAGAHSSFSSVVEPTTPGVPPRSPGTSPDDEPEEVPTDFESDFLIPIYKHKLPRYRPRSHALGRCCVERFEFPVNPVIDIGKTGVTNQASINPGGGGYNDGGRLAVQVAVWFNGVALYKPTPSPCNCECCEFRQYMGFSVKSQTPLSPYSAAEEFEHREGAREDCTWVVVTEEHGQKIKTNVHSGPDAPPRKTDGVLEVLGPFCEGGEAERKGVKDLMRVQRRRPSAGRGLGPCEDESLVDGPAILVERGSRFRWSQSFIGIIHDACCFWVPRRVAGFRYEIRGTVQADGTTTIDSGVNEDGSVQIQRL